MFAVISTVETAKKMTDERLQLVLGNADYSILSKRGGTFSEKYIEKASETEGVSFALGIMHKRAQIDFSKKKSKLQSRLRVTGLSTINSEMLELSLVEGDLHGNGLIITEETAKLWDIKVGDNLKLSTDNTQNNIKIIAIVKNTPLLEGPTNWKEAEDKIWRAVAPLSLVQQLDEQNYQLGELRIKLQSHVNKEQTEKKLSNLIENDKDLYLQTVVLDPKQTNQLDELYFMLYTTGGLAMLISAFILYNTLYVNVMERRNEIAIMKTIGYTIKQIKQLFLTEVGLLSIVGIIFGVPLGLMLSKFLQNSLFGSFQQNLSFETQYTIALPVVILLGLLIPYLAALRPIRYASKVDIIKNLKNIPDDKQSESKLRVIVGIICLLGVFLPEGLGILFILFAVFLLNPYITKGLLVIMGRINPFGFEGKIAIQSVERTLNRSSSMALILSLVICLGLFVSSIFHSMEENLYTDTYKKFGGNLQIEFEKPLDQGEEDRVSRTVSNVGEIHYYPEKLVNWYKENELRQFTIISVDNKWYQRNPLFMSVEKNNKHLLNKLENENTILLGTYAFNEWGGKVGEKITVQDNNREIRYTVIGNVSTTQYAGYTAFVSSTNFTNTFGQVQLQKGLIDLKNKEAEESVKRELVESFSNKISNIRSVKEELAQQQNTLNGIRPLFIMLMTLAIVVAGIGILNSLTISILDRFREIGVMRAIAFTSLQIRKMILIEGVAIGTIGVIVGVCLGTITSYLNILIENAQDKFSVPIDTLVIAILSGILISLLAALLPAYKATKATLIKLLKED